MISLAFPSNSEELLSLPVFLDHSCMLPSFLDRRFSAVGVEVAITWGLWVTLCSGMPWNRTESQSRLPLWSEERVRKIGFFGNGLVGLAPTLSNTPVCGSKCCRIFPPSVRLNAVRFEKPPFCYCFAYNFFFF